jgi:glycosyltransferase involved in cell wall biosynthesis
VSQRADVTEFNLPSKLMNYMSYGVPVIASVRPDSETAKIVATSGAGWVTDARHPHEFAALAARVLADDVALRRAQAAGRAFAREHFEPATVARRFEAILDDVVSGRAPENATSLRWRRGSGAGCPPRRSAA